MTKLQLSLAMKDFESLWGDFHKLRPSSRKVSIDAAAFRALMIDHGRLHRAATEAGVETESPA